MSEFFIRLTAASLSGLILGLILFSVKAILKHKMSKAWQYYIWSIVMLRLLLPYNPGFSASEWYVYNSSNFDVTQNGNISSQSSTEKVKTLALTEQVQEKASIDFNRREWPTGGRSILDYAMAAWIIIAVSLFLYRSINYMNYVKGIRVYGRIVMNPELQAAYVEACEEVGIKSTLPVYLSDRVETPMLAGILRPFIMLPCNEFTKIELHNIFIHELTHYKQRDILYKWSMQITACIHWFNPVIYLIIREMNRECELACDEAILKRLDAEGKRQYGNTLLASIHSGGNRAKTGIVLPLNEDAKLLKERLGSIMQFKKHKKITTFISAVLTLFMLVVAILIGAYFIPSDSVAAKETETEAILRIHPDNRPLAAIDINKISVIKLTIDTASINLITTNKDAFRLSYTGGADQSYHASVKRTGTEKEIAEITIIGETQQINAMEKPTELNSVTLEIPDRLYQSVDIEENRSVLSICELNAVVNARDTYGIISLKQSKLKRGSYALSTKQGVINVELAELLTQMKLDNSDGIMNINFMKAPETGKLLLGITGNQDYVTIPIGWDKYLINKDLSNQNKLPDIKAALSINNHSGFTTVAVSDNSKKAKAPITMKTATIMNEKYYLIENEEELRAIGSEEYPLSGNYMLNKDITLTKEWKAIGDDEAPFTGKFEGNGLTISNLTTTDKKAKYIGLFGYAKGAIIHNVILTNVDIGSAGGKGRSIGPIVAIAFNCEVEDCDIK